MGWLAPQCLQQPLAGAEVRRGELDAGLPREEWGISHVGRHINRELDQEHK